MLSDILYRVFYFLREALHGMSRNRFTHLVAVGTITFALLTFGIFLLTVINLNRIFDEWGRRIHLIAYLDDSINQQELNALRERITTLPSTHLVTFVSKEQALTLLKESLQGQSGILENLEVNPLPASLEIQLKDAYKNSQSLKAIVAEIKQFDKVRDVEYGQEWLEKFSAFISMVKLVGITIGCFLLLATIFIISNTIKLTIYSRRDEIEIMKLVGATNFFIQAPFFLEGLLQGLIGSLGALGTLYLGYRMFMSTTTAHYGFYRGPLTLVFLPQTLVVSLILFGVVLGVGGCILSMGRFLKA